MKQSRMNRIIKLICLVAAVLLLAACKKDNKKTSVQTTQQVTAAVEKEGTQEVLAERTKFVKLEVVNREDGIEIRILDEQNQKIQNTVFTVCLVRSEEKMVLDKTLSGTIEGMEYTDEDGDGALYISSLENGSYEIYLRPLEEYTDANPVPLSYVVYKFDENIGAKIHQSSEVDVEHEDKDYVSEEENVPVKSEEAVKVSNIINSGFILGNSETFTVNKPLLNENEEIQYEKLNSSELDSSINISDYVKENNKEELCIGGVHKTVYVYEEARFDPRVDEYYVSKAIIQEEGKYCLYTLVPHMTTGEEEVYVGWYSKKGKHYYNNEDGYPVTGWQKLDGLWYYFDANGQKASVTGIDVSEYQEEIDWSVLKESGIDFVIIRCGYRGYETGVLVEDARFKENIRKATEVGMPFGVYIFSQATSQAEAAEEASMILELCRGYEPTLPFAIDIEACGDANGQGRQNSLSVSARTQVINTFVNVIKSQGEEAMLYSNKSWLENQIDLSKINCKIWYAMWPGEEAEDEKEGTGAKEQKAPNDDAYEADETKVPDMEVEIWQYSDKGVVEGIEPLVDLNAWVPSLE